MFIKTKINEITRMPKNLGIDQKMHNRCLFITNLFHKFKILIFYNPKDINFDFIKNYK